MNKTQLIEKISTKTGMTKLNSQRFLDTMTEAIANELKKGGEVKLTGFMNFITIKRASRTGRNPQTGETIKIPAKRVIKTTVSKKLKELLN